MKLLQGVLEAVEGVVRDVLDGCVADVEDLDGFVLENVAIELLHVALGNVQLVDEGPDLAQPHGQRGYVGVVAPMMRITC